MGGLWVGGLVSILQLGGGGAPTQLTIYKLRLLKSDISYVLKVNRAELSCVTKPICSSPTVFYSYSPLSEVDGFQGS